MIDLKTLLKTTSTERA